MCVWDLDELLLQLVDGQALPLLQDGQLRLLSVRGLVASEGVLLPLWDVVGHHADAPHVGCDLPTVGCQKQEEGSDFQPEEKAYLYTFRRYCLKWLLVAGRCLNGSATT